MEIPQGRMWKKTLTSTMRPIVLVARSISNRTIGLVILAGSADIKKEKYWHIENATKKDK